MEDNFSIPKLSREMVTKEADSEKRPTSLSLRSELEF
jgi:hypothetical protein